MDSQSFATPSQQAAVAQTLRDTGGTFPSSVSAPTITAHSEWKPSLSPSLVDVIGREMAAGVVNPTTGDALSKHLGLDAKEVTAKATELLKSSGIEGDVSKLSATTLAALHAVAQQADQIAKYRGSKAP